MMARLTGNDGGYVQCVASLWCSCTQDGICSRLSLADVASGLA
jgi:hypothetical protein